MIIGNRIKRNTSIMRPAVVIIAALLLCGGTTSAQVKLASLSINSGGVGQTSTNYGATLTIGQVASGTSTSTSYQAMLGFWHALDLVVGVQNEPSDDLPMTYNLSQNYPNPFNPVTQIGFDLPRSEHVRLDVFNVLGRQVVTLLDQQFEAGYHTFEWDSKDAASGIYFYRLKAGSFIETKKMMLLK